MASRKEQKEQLRREREEREAAERASRRRKRLIGYVAGAVAVLVVVVVAVVVLAGSKSSGGGGGSSGSVLPGGGSVPGAKTKDLSAAMKAAGCNLTSYKGKGREHTADLSKPIKYDSNPPTVGNHYQVPADDGAYEKAPDVKQLVHSLEHGRVIVWFKKNLPKDDRAGLKALFDEDSYQVILTPDPTGMKYQVAASAWTRDPTPNGTGHLLACPKFDDATYDALRAFKDQYRGNGPEAIP